MPASQISRRTMLAGLAGSSLAASVGVPAGPVRAQPLASYRPGAQWGSLELLDTDDRSFVLGQSEAPFTLVKLWANWCAICMAELGAAPTVGPSLGGGLVDVVLVSHPQDWVRDRAVVRDRGLAVRCARPSPSNSRVAIQADLMAENGWYYVPRTLLFSRSRREVVWSHVGRLDWSDRHLRDKVRALLT